MAEIRFNRFQTDMREVVLGILQENVLQYNGGDAFLVRYGSPEKIKINAGMGSVYLWREESYLNGQFSVCQQTRTYTARIGVKEKCSSTPSLSSEQIDEYFAIFQEWEQMDFAFTYQGSPLGHLNDIGIGSVDTISSITDTDGSYFYTEFQVSLTAHYINKTKAA